MTKEKFKIVSMVPAWRWMVFVQFLEDSVDMEVIADRNSKINSSLHY